MTLHSPLREWLMSLATSSKPRQSDLALQSRIHTTIHALTGTSVAVRLPEHHRRVYVPPEHGGCRFGGEFQCISDQA